MTGVQTCALPISADFNGRPVRSNYFLSLLFDETQTRLFHNQKSIINGGTIPGALTWVSKNSDKKLEVYITKNGITKNQYLKKVYQTNMILEKILY